MVAFVQDVEDVNADEGSLHPLNSSEAALCQSPLSHCVFPDDSQDSFACQACSSDGNSFLPFLGDDDPILQGIMEPLGQTLVFGNRFGGLRAGVA